MHDSTTTSTTSANGLPRARLLIVDGDADIRELHALVLSLEGYDVETACDGATALERLAEEKFDLVLTDRLMPNLDGASMVLALRTAGMSIPAIMFNPSLAHSPLPPQVAREFSATVPKPARTAEILSAAAFALRATAPPESGRHFREPERAERQPRAIVLRLRQLAQDYVSMRLRFNTPEEQLITAASSKPPAAKYL